MSELTEEARAALAEEGVLFTPVDTFRVVVACFAFDALEEHDSVARERIETILKTATEARFTSSMVDLAISGHVQIGWDRESESMSFTERTAAEREAFLRYCEAHFEEEERNGSSQTSGT